MFSTVSTLQPPDTRLMPDFVLPALSRAAADPEEIVRCALAARIGELAQTAQRLLEVAHWMRTVSLSHAPGGFLERSKLAVLRNPISSTLWGGMQWQLEHHLFPTIPRYRYPALSKVLKAFADEHGPSHGFSYRESEELQILVDNVKTISRMATQPAQPGNPSSEPVFKQV